MRVPIVHTMALTALALLPFAFGGGPVWAWGTVALVIGVCLAVSGVCLLVQRCPQPPTPGALLFALAIAGGLAIFAGLQTVPGLPGAHPVWAGLADALANPPPGTWSMTPVQVWPGVAMLLMLAGILWLPAQMAPRRGADPALPVFATAGAVASGYGLLVLAAGSEQVLWLAKADYRDVATGPFINRNAFAAYLGLAFCAAVAGMQRRWQAGETVWPWYPPGVILLLAGLVASESRGGMAAAALALGVLLWLSVLRHASLRTFGLGMAATLGLALATGLFLADRATGIPSALARRGEIYAAAWDLVAQRPWLGHGLGSFEAAFRQVRPESLERVVTQAHNVYLHGAVTLGLPAAALAVTAFLALAVACARAAWAGAPAGTAGFGAAILLGTHGLIDFAPQVPGVAVTGAWFMGAGAAFQPVARDRAVRRRWRFFAGPRAGPRAPGSIGDADSGPEPAS